MRTKSKYREFRDGGRVNLPGQKELPIEQPVETVTPAPETPTAAATVDNSQPKPPEAPQQLEQPQPPEAKQDDATLALQKQLEAIKKSEEIQRQHAAQAALPQQPLSREQRLAAWRQQGLSEPEAAFFARNPDMIDHPDITAFAAKQALEAGHERGTDVHFDTLKKVFDENFNNLQTQTANPAEQPTPAFFKPPPPPRPRAAPTMSSRVSAPVSRQIPTSGGRRRDGSVTLSHAQQEAAKVAGISIQEYARQLLRYEGMKESGEYGTEEQR